MYKTFQWKEGESIRILFWQIFNVLFRNQKRMYVEIFANESQSKQVSSLVRFIEEFYFFDAFSEVPHHSSFIYQVMTKVKGFGIHLGSQKIEFKNVKDKDATNDGFMGQFQKVS